MSRHSAFTGPSVKFACVMRNENYRAVVEATIRLREKTGRSVSPSVVVDALVQASDMDAIVEEIAKRGTIAGPEAQNARERVGDV